MTNEGIAKPPILLGARPTRPRSQGFCNSLTCNYKLGTKIGMPVKKPVSLLCMFRKIAPVWRQALKTPFFAGSASDTPAFFKKMRARRPRTQGFLELAWSRLLHRKVFLPVVACAVILFQIAATGQNMSEKPAPSVKQPAQNTTEAPEPSTKPVSVDKNPETAPEKQAKAPAKPKYLTGEDPDMAAQYGWPVKYPELLAGSILPDKRIVAYYGNPRSKQMGVLGEYPKNEMLARLKSEAEKWEHADPAHKVQTALHLIAVVAQETPGTSNKYRRIMPDETIEEVYGWAKESGAILFIDIQAGHDDIRELLPRFEWILKNPDVHLAIDPEFYMISNGKVPGTVNGTIDAKDINYASDYLRTLINKYNLPPKVFVIHRWTRNMLTNADKIKLSPELAIVIHMDGWGAPSLKRSTYRDVIVREPVQFSGFKLFYRHDTKNDNALLTPQQIMRLIPTPLYIQYQ